MSSNIVIQFKIDTKCPRCKGQLWGGFDEKTVWCDNCGELKK